MLDIKKFFSILALGTVMLMTSCMDLSSNDAEPLDLAPLLDKQALFEKKLISIILEDEVKNAKKILGREITLNKDLSKLSWLNMLFWTNCSLTAEAPARCDN